MIPILQTRTSLLQMNMVSKPSTPRGKLHSVDTVGHEAALLAKIHFHTNKCPHVNVKYVNLATAYSLLSAEVQ